MKIIQQIKIILLATFLLISCNSNLEKLPDGQLTREQAFSQPSIAVGFLSDCYASVPQYFDSYHFHTMLAAFSDEAVDSQNGLAAWDWHNGRLSTTYDPIGYWSPLWTAIRKTNLFLENIDLAPVADAGGADGITSDQKRQMTAEARFLRAFFHFELMKYYGGMPIMDRTFAPSEDFNLLERATFDSCANWIATECDEIVPHLPVRRVQGGDSFNSGIDRATSMMALALKSRVLLYSASPLNNPDGLPEKWQKAADAAKQAIELAVVSQKYKLFESDDFEQAVSQCYHLFRQRDNGGSATDEIIWQQPKVVHSLGHFTFVNSLPSVGGYKAGMCPTQELVDAFEMINGEPPIVGYSDSDHLTPIINPDAGYNPNTPYADRDPRLTAYIYYNGALWGKRGNIDHYVNAFEGGADGIRQDLRYTKTGYYIRKFVDPTRGNGTVSSYEQPSGQAYWPIFRLAELYLNYAEAENEANGPTIEAVNAINMVRKRANMPAINAKFLTSEEEFRNRIWNERRVELAFEEHRFFDVRRWNILDETDKLVSGMNIIPNANGGYDFNRFIAERRSAWSEKYNLLPIPNGEINRLKGFDQNAGWK